MTIHNRQHYQRLRHKINVAKNRGAFDDLIAPNIMRTSSFVRIHEKERGRFGVTNFNRQISKGYRQEKGVTKIPIHITKI